MGRALTTVAALAVVGLGAGVAWVVYERGAAPVPALAPAAQASTLPSPVANDDDGEERPRPADGLREAGQPPDNLVRNEILVAMERVKPRVANCFDLYNQPGLATVQMTVTSAGHVASAKVIGALAGTPTAECVENAARAASFRPFKRPSVTLTWPFVLKVEGEE